MCVKGTALTYRISVPLRRYRLCSPLRSIQDTVTVITRVLRNSFDYIIIPQSVLQRFQLLQSSSFELPFLLHYFTLAASSCFDILTGTTYTRVHSLDQFLSCNHLQVNITLYIDIYFTEWVSTHYSCLQIIKLISWFKLNGTLLELGNSLVYINDTC